MSGHLARVRDDRGSATAEIALALPSLMLVLAAVLAAGQVLMAQIQCVDAARSVARLAARGEPGPRAVAAGDRLGPPGCRVELALTPTAATVQVSARLQLPVAGEVEVHAAATADRETVPATSPEDAT